MPFQDRIRLPALNLIHRRSRLLNMLTEFVETEKRLITVYAPGGYGKSILLADFAQTIDFPVCWCSLEPVDRDPTSFLSLLAYSLTDRFHDIQPNGLFKLIDRGDTQTSIRRLADILTGIGPHIIIVDDYQKAVSAGMTLALNRLLEQLPESSTMIIAARGDMALETSQILDLLISERATGLSEEELRFTTAEIQRVMLKRFGRQIDLETAEEIAQATDGNIAQILLTGHVEHAGQLIDRLHGRLGDDRVVIYSYLAEEVFDKQPADLQRFMLHTAILPDMTVEVCNELLEITDAQTRLETLVSKDLFISQIGTGYRYHDLFAEFLRGKLSEDEALYRQVSIRAAEILAARTRFEDAMNLYLSVQAWDEAATLLETEGRFFYDTGRALTLNDWLVQISEQELAQHPRLLLLKGRILHDDLGEPKSALTIYQQAEAEFRKQGDLIGAAEAQIFRSVALGRMGRAKESLALATKGLEQLEALNADRQVMARAIRYRGLAHWTAGNLDESLADRRRALELFEDLANKHSVGLCHHEIGVILVAQGNVSGADHHYRQALRIWETLGNANDLANTLNSLGVSLYVTGRYDEALRQFNDSLDIALQIGATRRAAFAQAGIGDAYLACQEYDEAAEAYQKSTELARKANVRSLEIYNLVKLGECYYERGEPAEALKLADQARQIAAESGLSMEQGLACALQAKIYVCQEEYRISFELFSQALTCLAENDVLEQAKVRLWWGYSLLLDLRPAAAFEQLQQAIRLTLNLGELMPGLRQTVAETSQLLLHFLYRADTSAGMQDSIRQLLAQSDHRVEIKGPSLQVFAFGVPTLIVAGVHRQFSQRGKIRKAPEFLLHLILEGQGGGCRWSEISAAIWPELDSDKVSITFHQTLRRLRETILDAPDYVTVHDDYYQINPQYFEWCDALTFNTLFERAMSASPEETLQLYLEMISLYHGEFLAGFELEDWGSTRRAGYEARFLQVVTLASEQLLNNGSPQEALTILNKGLAQDYFRENLHRNAFKAYARLGLYDTLVEYYTYLCVTFEQEFGAPPEPETQQLYEQLMTER